MNKVPDDSVLPTRSGWFPYQSQYLVVRPSQDSVQLYRVHPLVFIKRSKHPAFVIIRRKCHAPEAETPSVVFIGYR